MNATDLTVDHFNTFHRRALTGVVTVRLLELPELQNAPREFTHGWLPMAVEAAVNRFADAVTAEVADFEAAHRRFHYHQFIAEGYVEQIATAARIWVEASGVR